MPKAPRLKGRELIRCLERHGFAVARIKGSHHILEHFDKRKTVVPVHGAEIIGPGLLQKILRDTELSSEDLL